MKAYIAYFLITLVICGGITYSAMTDASYQARKNCSVAEISPDFTPEERKKCRELLRHKL